MKLSKTIRHVCLNTPSNPIQSFAGRNGKVYGWGLTEELELASELHHVEVPLVNQALCNSSGPTLRKIMSDTSFCAGARDGQTGACNGKYYLPPTKFKRALFTAVKFLLYRLNFGARELWALEA
jgi:hypothetical protein